MKRFLLTGILLGGTSGCFLFGGGANGPATEDLEDDPRFAESVDGLDENVAKWTEGFESQGEPVEGSLDAFEILTIGLKGGRCYRVVIRLEEGAKFSVAARKGIEFRVAGEGHPTQISQGIHGPGGIASVGCALDDQVATFDMYVAHLKRSEGRYDLGTGKYTAELFGQDAEGEDLAKLETRRAIQRSLASRPRVQDSPHDSFAPSSGRSDASAGSGVVSVDIKNECRDTVRVFYGDQPKYGSGTESSLSGNSRTSKSMHSGDKIWLIDGSGNGITAVTVSGVSQSVVVNTNCNGFL
jgi:hypothetical protein